MRILLTANLAPFLPGGADYHIQGVFKALRNHGHEVELLRFPFQFSPLQSIRGLMAYCQSLQLDHPNGVSVDRMISLQFPGYGIQHENHWVWLMHQHRAVYELYDVDNKDQDLQQLRGDIHSYDIKALQQSRKVFANSRQVADRLQQYNGLKSEPLYHPPAFAEQFFCDEALPYIFYPSRFESLKRQDLLIEAARYLQTPVKILLAGEGGQLGRCQDLVRQYKLEDTVRFLGRITEAEKLAYYSHALAVAYVPDREDYGYVTLEAMLSSKAVITTSDAGGPLEFVSHEETGLVCDPDPRVLAEVIDRACTDAEATATLGRNGREAYRTQGISWDNVVDKLTIGE